jgi:hypothetical protein
MSEFVIQPHFRLQEWIAHEKGYFTDEGLDYIFNEEVKKTDGKVHDKGFKQGAYQSFESGRKSDVSCACHWTVGVAASKKHGKLYPKVYSVAPTGIFVPADSPIKTPADLAGVPIAVGYQSGSHYATIQALEQYMPADKINLDFGDGMLFKRTTTGTSSPSASIRRWIRAVGDLASASCSSPTPRKSSTRRSSGSSRTGSSRITISVRESMKSR